MADLGTAYVNIVPKAQGISSQIEDLLGDGAEKAGSSAGEKAGSGLAKGVGKALIGTAAAVGSAVVGAGAALVSGTSEVAAYADSIDKMSQKLGMSATAYQEWDAIMQHSGTSISSMQRGMMTLSNAAQGGSEAFEKIGLSAEQAAKMSQEDLFAAVITGLQGMEEGSERAALAQDLLGGAAKELGPLLNTSAEETEAMRQRVHELGGVLSDDAVKGGAAFQDTLQDMNTAIGGVKNSIMTQFMPGMTQMMDGFTSLVLGEEGAVDAISGGLDSLLTSVDQVAGPFLDAFSALIPQLIPVLISHLPQMIEGGMQLLMAIIQGILAATPQLITAGLQIIITLIQGLSTALPQLIAAVVEIVPQVAQALVTALPQLILAGIQLMIAIINGIVQSLPQLIAAVTEMIPMIATTLIQNLPALISAGIELTIAILSGIVQAIPQLLQFVPQLFQQCVSAFSAIDWKSLGSQIINGIVNGITTGATKIFNALKDLAKNALNKAKEALGIGSPSKLFAQEVGRWIPPGVAMGIDDNLMPIQDSINGMVRLAAADFATASGAPTIGQTQQSNAMDYDRLAAAIASRPIQIVGDTNKIFKVVRKQNNVITKATNYNPLAAGV